MNDYKELIEKLKSCEKDSRSLLNAFDQRNADAIRQAADAIDELAKERDAAIVDLTGAKPCRACKHIGFGLDHCKHCFSDNCFEWRGVQEVEHETD